MSAETDKHTNEDYKRWVNKLDECDADLSPYEAKFVASNKDRTFFTDPQREVILNMVEKYL